MVTGNDAGAYIPVGGKASIKVGVSITDLAMNLLDPASKCATGVVIAETPRPVPVKTAEMRDYEGDGIADEIFIKFEKALREKDMLDSFVVEWGTPNITNSYKANEWEHTFEKGSHYEYTYDTASTSPTFGAKLDSALVEDSVSIITIKFNSSNGFPQGATNGIYSDGYGHVTPRLGPEGGFFDKYYMVIDKCAPILMTAKTDTSGNYTTLTVTASEPLTPDSSETLEYIERMRGTTAGVYLRSTRSVKMNGSNQIYLYAKDADDAVQAGDSIRLVPISTLSRYKDIAGNFPTASNPWRIVTGAAGSTKFTVTLVNSITHSNGNPNSYGIYTPAKDEPFRISVVKDGQETILDRTNDDMLAISGKIIDANYQHAGPVFDIEITLPSALMKDTLNGITSFINNIDVKFSIDVFDNMGQFINSQSININAETVRNITSDDGIIHLNLEWLAHDGEAPISKSGKKIATGAYIAKFDFKASEENIKTHEKSTTKDNTTKTFGFKRTKKK